ncbi:MAG: hypothetical protein ABFS42_05160 [Candidatus Krumholzibacteriota bacterium]
MWPTMPFAQGSTNLMGLAAEPIWAEWCIEGPGHQVYQAYLYIQNPVNPDFGTGGGENPVSWINGFECRLWIEGDATVVGWSFPVDAIDAGTNGNTVVGFAQPVPVVDGRAIVATLDIFLGNPGKNVVLSKQSPTPCDQATALVHLSPTRPASSIEGMMSYLDADDPVDPLVGAVPFWAIPEDIVLLLEAQVVDVEQQAWGGIKALYR